MIVFVLDIDSYFCNTFNGKTSEKEDTTGQHNRQPVNNRLQEKFAIGEGEKTRNCLSSFLQLSFMHSVLTITQ